MPSTFIPGMQRLALLERELHKRVNESGEYYGPAWLAEDVLAQRRIIANRIAVMLEAGCQVTKDDLAFMAEWLDTDVDNG